jgi:PAS domain S-box-containing protein
MLQNNPLLNYWSRLSLFFRGAIFLTISSLCLLATLATWFWSRFELLDFRAKIDRTQNLIEDNQEIFVALLNAETRVPKYLLLFTFAGVLSTLSGIYLFWLLARELKQRKAQIQTQDSILQTLTNNIVDGIIILDDVGQIQTVNPSLVNMLGYTAEDLLKCSLADILTAKTTNCSGSLSELLNWLEQMPKLEQIWQIEGYRQDGTNFPLEFFLSEIPQQKQWIAIFRDVSEQVYLMQQLQTHLNELEQLNLTIIRVNSILERRNQELAEFAYVTAHDLKTPVRGIAILSEWIEEEVKTYSSQQVHYYLKLLRERTYRLNALIDGLWEYTNLGQTNLAPELVELDLFFQEIQNSFPLPSNFEIQFQHTDIKLTTCKSHLSKVLEELLKNAVKHHDRDCGKIQVNVQI